MRVRLTLGVVLGFLVCSAVYADPPWTVSIEGGGAYKFAAESGTSDLPLVNVLVLARELGLVVLRARDRATITDTRGIAWTVADGSSLLESTLGTRTRTLSRPADVTPAAVSLPLDAVADLAGRRLSVDNRRAVLRRGSEAPASSAAHASAARAALSLPASAQAAVPPGWDRLEIAKTPEELAETLRLEGDVSEASAVKPTADVLPRSHEALSFDVGAGFAQGFSGATDLAVSGSVSGFRVSLTTFLTYAGDGMTYRAGRFVLEEPDAKWTIEAGDLMSDVRGMARGFRVSKPVTSWWRPSVAVYVPNRSLVVSDHPAFAYRDDLRLPGAVSLNVEALSDGSAFAGVRWTGGRTTFDTFYRYLPRQQAHDEGASVSYDVWRGVTARFGAHLTTGAVDDRWYSAGVTVPVARGAMATFDRAARAFSASDSNTVGVTLPIGGIRVMQRYQWTDDALVTAPSLTAPGYQQVQSIASYTPVRGVQLSYQLARQWTPSSAQQWTEMQATYNVNRSTSFHAVTEFPDVRNAQHIRFGLQQQLGGSFRLDVDYGHLPAYQATPVRGLNREPMRFVVMVHRELTRATPAGGTTVAGRVVDESGEPVPGAAVRLGPYLASAQSDGSYRFDHVPRGGYDLSLDPEHLPAGYSSSAAVQPVGVSRGGAVRRDLHATTLQSIEGHVFVDRNGNGRFDGGEGIAEVVVRLGADAATTTGEDGAYAFHNLAPDRYTVRVDRERLDRTLAVVGHAVADVELTSNRDTRSGIDFVLEPTDKPVLLQRTLPE